MRVQIRTILALLGVFAAISCTPAVPASVDPATAGTASAVPGDDGPCGVERSDHFNPAGYKFAVSLYQPTGAGFCGDDARPLIVLAHGYTSTVPEPYEALIKHLVSRGFIVIYPGYTADYNPPAQYGAVDGGIDVGVTASGRVDTTRVGVVGHSFGGGMTPYLLRRIVERGWGSQALFGVMLSPAWGYLLPEGAIELPEHTRLLVISYEDDVFVDMQVGIELRDAANIPASHKGHLLIHTDNNFDPPLVADHLLPLVLPFDLLGGADHYDRWATWRPIDAVADCSLWGTNCDLDLADLGTLHGAPVRRASSGLDLRDVGPPAIVECLSLLSPRPCSFG